MKNARSYVKFPTEHQYLCKKVQKAVNNIKIFFKLNFEIPIRFKLPKNHRFIISNLN